MKQLLNKLTREIETNKLKQLSPNQIKKKQWLPPSTNLRLGREINRMKGSSRPRKCFYAKPIWAPYLRVDTVLVENIILTVSLSIGSIASLTKNKKLFSTLTESDKTKVSSKRKMLKVCNLVVNTDFCMKLSYLQVFPVSDTWNIRSTLPLL